MTAFLKRLSARTRSRKAQLALALRVTLAAAAAYAIATALHLMLPLWAVLTSLIVTQMSVGRSLKASRDYMLGTVGGAIYGGAIAVLIPHSGEIGLLALLVLAVAPLAFIAAIHPSLNAAIVTAVIVLLVPEMRHANPLDSVIDRVMEVTVGAVTGLLVSFLVLPSRAHSQIRVNAARLLDLLGRRDDRAGECGAPAFRSADAPGGAVGQCQRGNCHLSAFDSRCVAHRSWFANARPGRTGSASVC